MNLCNELPDNLQTTSVGMMVPDYRLIARYSVLKDRIPPHCTALHFKFRAALKGHYDFGRPLNFGRGLIEGKRTNESTFDSECAIQIHPRMDLPFGGILKDLFQLMYRFIGKLR